MTPIRSRRQFLAEVGKGVFTATLGFDAASQLALGSSVPAEDASRSISFGAQERLVGLMQETPVERLLPVLTEQLQTGSTLRQLVAAAALANARTFGGEDYVGFHTMMALGPAFQMAQELPAKSQALPVFKVLYRNTSRIQEFGGRSNEVLHPVETSAVNNKTVDGEMLREAVRSKNMNEAEALFARIARTTPENALNQLLWSVQDETDVHRVVLPYRAWDMLELVGRDQAHTMLRQSVRYCVRAENRNADPRSRAHRRLLTALLEENHLLDRARGSRHLDDAAVDKLSQVFFGSTPEQSAVAAATSLAEGVSPADVGEAIALAANQLVLRDLGRPPQAEAVGKPVGSVHGDSIGVHACDSANAWRNLSRVGNDRNCFASLIMGAYQVALDRTARGGDFMNWLPLPYGWQFEQVKKLSDPAALLQETEEAIRGNLQVRAAGLVHHYGNLGHPPRPVFDLLLKYAVSEDGALHAEKFYRTVSDEFTSSRVPFRWRHLVALARVTASECGRQAPGMAQARELLKV